MAYVSVDPSVGFGFPTVFLTDTDAAGSGVAETEEDWLCPFGFGVDCVSVAVLTIRPEPQVTRTTSVSVTVAPSGNVPIVQVIVGTPFSLASWTEPVAEVAET